MTLPRFVANVFVGASMLLTAAASAESEADRIQSIERERLRSLVEADLETADRLHAVDFELINPLGGKVPKEQYLKLVGSGEVDYLEWEPEEVEVKLYGDAAVLRYRARLRIVVKGAPDAPTGSFWHTDLYEKRDGRWQAVWSQATQIQP